MPKMNWNKVAVAVAKIEGKKKQTDIAQIKEIINATMTHIYKRHSFCELCDGITFLVTKGQHKSEMRSM